MPKPKKSRAEGEAAAMLRAQGNEILLRWEERVRRARTGARPSEAPFLRDHFNTFIRDLTLALGGKPPKRADLPSLERLPVTPAHGNMLARVILEYRLLRETIFDVIEAQGPLEPSVREAILDVVETAIQEAAEVFSRAQEKASYWTEDQFQLLLDNARDFAIFLLDVDAHIISWNVGAEAITGYRVGDVVGEHVSCLYIHEDAADVVRKEIRTACIDGKVESERWHIRKDGTRFWASGLTTALRTHDGVLCGFSCLIRDRTTQKELEIALTERAEDLSEANRHKDEFLAMLAHELRNPLAPILHSIRAMKLRRLEDPMLIRSRDVVERQVRHMSRLLDDLLNVTRIAHGKIVLRRERTDIAMLLRQSVEDFRRDSESRDLELKADIPSQPMWINGDPTRLVQVFSNLLGNALKFTNGGDSIHVDMTAQPELGTVSVQVRDTGIGIPHEMLQAIFETFTQGSQGPDHGKGGLGLGLAMVKGLVEMHGGHVYADSDGPGRGSVFTVILPLAASDEAARISTSSHPDDEEPLRIVVIDDNQDAAESLLDLLHLYGHVVAAAFSGQEGIRLCREFRPQVALCDIGLPDMDGYEVAKLLRADPQTANITLIAVSGYGQKNDRDRSFEGGFELHLTKPVDPDGLRLLMSGLSHRHLR